MNLLYLSLINIEKKVNSGVNKKIDGQIKAMRRQGLTTYRIALKNSGLYAFYDGKEILLKESLFFNKYEFIEKRVIYYKSILDFIKDKNIKVIYIRYQLSDPFFIRFIRKCKEIGLRIYLEVATYPYHKEIGGLILFIDNFYRKYLHKYIDNIITYSVHDTIFGIKTIGIGNGIDVDSLKALKCNYNSDVINLIGVASVSKWHGFDRVIKGLAEYYKNNNEKQIFFHIVGIGPEINNLKKLTKELALENYIIFHGFKSGKELDEVFDRSDIGVGSLGMYRIGLKSGYTLKLREYCARGLPFIYGYFDSDFANFKYSKIVSNSHEAINIEKIIKFYYSIKNENYIKEMRKYAIKELSWDAKMKPIIKKILSTQGHKLINTDNK